MSQIKILPEEIYNKIAAGEVIERPAAVVRELLENSIDSGADSIRVSISGGSTGLIEVRDNGCGMTANDIKIALQKHATSKISSFDDIYKLNSLGFRGEALPSIASVSEFEIISSNDNSGEGAHFILKGGKIISHKPCTAPKGTGINIKNLFFNTPARKKFLKSDRSEFQAIRDIVFKIIIANHNIDFEFYQNNKKQINIPAHYSLLDKLKYFFPDELCSHLKEIKAADDTDIRVSGYITDEHYSEKTRRNQYFIIGNRVVENSTLSSVLYQAYQNILPKGSKPAAFIFFDFPAHRVDINVHPSKKEIRFENDREIFSLLFRIIRANLLGYKMSSFSTHKPLIENDLPILEKRFDKENFNQKAEQLGFSLASSRDTNTNQDQLRKNELISENILKNEIYSDQDKAAFSDDSIDAGFNIIGQLDNSYILFEAIEKENERKSLFIVDQHALHERINYQILQHKTKSKDFDFQYLLTPILIQKGKKDMQELKEKLDILAELGLECEMFGEDTLKIEKIPVFIPEKKENIIINDMINAILEKQFPSREDYIDSVITRAACRMSIMAGDHLSAYAMQELIQKMYSLDLVQTCPHGRPFIKSIRMSEINKYFMRQGK